MADISRELQAILSAVYGEDVRGSIHDAIKKINDVSEVVLSTGTAVTSPTSSVEGFYEDSLYINTDTSDLWKCTGTGWELLAEMEGASIASIEKTSTSGLVDTYTVTLTNGVVAGTFDVTNGRDATGSTFSSLDDVTFTSLADKQIAQYDSTSQEWKNSSALADTQEMIAPIESATALANRAIGDEFILGEYLYKAISAISQGDSIVTSGTGQNAELAGTIVSQLKSLFDDEELLKSLPLVSDLNIIYGGDGLRCFAHDATADNRPLNKWGFVIEYQMAYNSSYVGFQADVASDMTAIHIRRLNSGTWGNWSKIYDSTIGTIYSSTTRSTTSISAGTQTELCKIQNVPAGTYIATGYARYDSAAGEKYIGIGIGTTVNGSQLYSLPLSLGNSPIRLSSILELSSTSTVYLGGYYAKNSADSLTIGAVELQLIRVA